MSIVLRINQPCPSCPPNFKDLTRRSSILEGGRTKEVFICDHCDEVVCYTMLDGKGPVIITPEQMQKKRHRSPRKNDREPKIKKPKKTKKEGPLVVFEQQDMFGGEPEVIKSELLKESGLEQ